MARKSHGAKKPQARATARACFILWHSRLASSALSGLAIEFAFGKLGQELVGGVLLVERLLQKRYDILHPELLCPGDHRAVAGDLVMLDGLRVGDHAGIEHVGILGVLHVLLALFKDA